MTIVMTITYASFTPQNYTKITREYLVSLSEIRV